MNEHIVAAAIKLSTGIVCHVPAPWGHSDIVNGLVDHVKTCVITERLGPLVGENCIQGFLTSKGRFVNRTEGLAIAIKEKQISKKHGNNKTLYSEDLWHERRELLYQEMLKIGSEEEYASYFQFWRNQYESN